MNTGNGYIELKKGIVCPDGYGLTRRVISGKIMINKVKREKIVLNNYDLHLEEKICYKIRTSKCRVLSYDEDRMTMYCDGKLLLTHDFPFEKSYSDRLSINTRVNSKLIKIVRYRFVTYSAVHLVTKYLPEEGYNYVVEKAFDGTYTLRKYLTDNGKKLKKKITNTKYKEASLELKDLLKEKTKLTNLIKSKRQSIKEKWN